MRSPHRLLLLSFTIILLLAACAPFWGKPTPYSEPPAIRVDEPAPPSWERGDRLEAADQEVTISVFEILFFPGKTLLCAISGQGERQGHDLVLRAEDILARETDDPQPGIVRFRELRHFPEGNLLAISFYADPADEERPPGPDFRVLVDQVVDRGTGETIPGTWELVPLKMPPGGEEGISAMGGIQPLLLGNTLLDEAYGRGGRAPDLAWTRYGIRFEAILIKDLDLDQESILHIMFTPQEAICVISEEDFHQMQATEGDFIPACEGYPPTPHPPYPYPYPYPEPTAPPPRYPPPAP